MSGGVARDLVVVVPGIMGSSLADEEGREVWGLSAGTILKALTRLGTSLGKLTLPSGLADGPAPDGVVPTGLIGALHVIPGLWIPVQGYEALVRFLLQPRFGLSLDHPEVVDAPPGNLLLFAYDWRLSNRHTAELLKQRVERGLARWQASHPDRQEAKVIFICHSMGGLVARWYLDKLEGAKVTRALITAGTPYRGALKALEQLINGVRVGFGPLKADLACFARSLPSSYQLLPEYACIEENGVLRKTTELELPKLDPTLVRGGMEFHQQLDDCPPPAYPLHPVVGIDQPTWTTARIGDDERVVPLNTIEDHEPAGDGTVPRFSARPNAMSEHDPSLQGLTEGHGSLVVHGSMLDQLDFVLTAEDLVYREAGEEGGAAAGDLGLGVSVPDLHNPGEPVEVTIHSLDRDRALQVVATDEFGQGTANELVGFNGEVDERGRYTGTVCIEGLDPSGYLITLRAPDDPRGLEISPVHATTLVWGAE
jgi:pimeloyl-ACP methyl ester carboxylesterase